MIDPKTLPQRIYRRHEIPIADELMSFQDALRSDFMGNFSSLEEAIRAQGVPALQRTNVSEEQAMHLAQSKIGDNQYFSGNYENWKAVNIKYEHRDMNIRLECSRRQREKYKTAYHLLQKYGDENCPILNYSCMAPNTVIQRHTGVENRTGEFVRIHIPLIIPKGDVFFEVYGEVVDWSDLFAFNNQFVHSAHNLTSEYRLVFLLDLRRSLVGLPPGSAYDERLELEAPPFRRNSNN